ncbi:MAG: terpene cyclase/mutase family protein [Clostridia bacterium]|nr:terpene cyclase/mutase family protein [Clostridia bacterium]
MKKAIAFILILAISLSVMVIFGADADIDSATSKSGGYILDTVKNPVCASVGGEWAVLGLARSGINVPEGYFDNYYENLCNYLKACNGVMHRVKYTEYSRAIIALTAIGEDPSDVSGYNLLLPLSDFDKTVKQGINGPIWALIALDSGNYKIPENKNVANLATRRKYVDYILSKQMEDVTWSLSGEGTDADITAMALVALSKYKEYTPAETAIDRAILKMSELQNPSGGFMTDGTESVESTAQMLTALSELGISHEDSRFTKNGNTLLTNLLSYMLPDGSFFHTNENRESNLMATEQAFYALASAKRARDGENTLYNMSDIAKKGNVSYNRECAICIMRSFDFIEEALGKTEGNT